MTGDTGAPGIDRDMGPKGADGEKGDTGAVGPAGKVLVVTTLVTLYST